jgi:hypothetical protein
MEMRVSAVPTPELANHVSFLNLLNSVPETPMASADRLAKDAAFIN